MKKTVQAIFAGVFLLSVILVSLPALGWPDHEVTKYIYHKGKTIEVKDGMNVKGLDLRWAEIHTRMNPLGNADFSDCNLSESDLQETNFHNCSFRGANLSSANCYDTLFTECDLTGAIINGALYLPVTRYLRITQEQLRSTGSYRKKNLSRIGFADNDFSGIDFSRCNLRDSDLRAVNLEGCRFDGAWISGAHFRGGRRPSGGEFMTRTQLASTLDFKYRRLINVTLSNFDLSGLDLSRFNLTGCTFYPQTDFEGVDLTDSVITNCRFVKPTNITFDQIKSTWNYKMGNMDNVVLPEDIQKAFDAEKKTKAPVEEIN